MALIKKPSLEDFKKEERSSVAIKGKEISPKKKKR